MPFTARDFKFGHRGLIPVVEGAGIETALLFPDMFRQIEHLALDLQVGSSSNACSDERTS
jgi:hypothetical protein